MTRRGRDAIGWILLALLVAWVGMRAWSRRADVPSPVGPERAVDGPVTPAPAVAPGPSEGSLAREPPPRLDPPPRPAAPRDVSPDPAPAEPGPAPLPGPPPALVGVVTTDDWFRVPGADVLLSRERPGRDGDRLTPPAHVVARTRTDADGRFAFDTAPEGTLHVSVLRATHPEGGALADACVATRAGAEEVTIRVRGRPGCWVRVVDPDGRPLADAEVRLSPPHGTPAWIPSDADGWAHLPLARPGDPTAYRLAVNPPRDRVDLDGLLDQPWQSEMALGHGGTVSGTVEDAQGRPVAGALVTARDLGNPGRGLLPGASGADGRFRFGGLRGGPVEITARPPEAPEMAGEWPGARAEVGATDVRIALPPVADLPVTVEGVESRVFVALRRQVDVRRRPPSAARSGAYDPPERAGVPGSETWAVRPTDDAGRVRFRAIPSDRVYVLWMLPDEDGRTFVRPDVRPDGREVRVRAERGRPTAVRVDGGRDLWINGAWAVDAHGAVYDVEREAGSARFPSLPPGPWHVVARLHRFARASDLRSPRRSDLVPEEPLGIQEYAEADGVAGGEILLVPTRR